jgi:hypothetical protein
MSRIITAGLFALFSMLVFGQAPTVFRTIVGGGDAVGLDPKTVPMRPEAITFDSQGRMVIASRGNIYRLNAARTRVQAVLTATRGFSQPLGGPLSQQNLVTVRDMKYDSSGALWLNVKNSSLSSQLVRVDSSGVVSVPNTNLLPTSEVALDSNGRVWMLHDNGTAVTLRRYTPSGNSFVDFCTITSPCLGTGGISVVLSVSANSGVAVRNDRVFIQNGIQLVEIDPGTNTATTGLISFPGLNPFVANQGLQVDSTGVFYVRAAFQQSIGSSTNSSRLFRLNSFLSATAIGESPIFDVNPFAINSAGEVFYNSSENSVVKVASPEEPVAGTSRELVRGSGDGSLSILNPVNCTQSGTRYDCPRGLAAPLLAVSRQGDIFLYFPASTSLYVMRRGSFVMSPINLSAFTAGGQPLTSEQKNWRTMVTDRDGNLVVQTQALSSNDITIARVNLSTQQMTSVYINNQPVGALAVSPTNNDLYILGATLNGNLYLFRESNSVLSLLRASADITFNGTNYSGPAAGALPGFGSSTLSLSFEPSGRYLFYTAGRIRRWDSTNGDILVIPTGPNLPGGGQPALVAASGAENVLFTKDSLQEATLHWSSLTTQQPVTGTGTPNAPFSGSPADLREFSTPVLAYHPDGFWLAFQHDRLLMLGSNSTVPFGSFDSPATNTTVSSQISVTGWALHEFGVARLIISRDPVAGDPAGAIGVNGLVYIGDALFVNGARPDVAALYPAFAQSQRAGWGYPLLTYGLPGDGTYVIHATAVDFGGREISLGTKNITVNNGSRIKPVGTLDTPTVGGIVSGNAFHVSGWVVTPLPNTINPNCSGVRLVVDVVERAGTCTYGGSRPDVAATFPSIPQAATSGTSFVFDSTAYTDGLHEISWVARDSATNEDGIGSRLVTFSNGVSGGGNDAGPQRPDLTAWDGLGQLKQMAERPMQQRYGLNGQEAWTQVKRGFDGNWEVALKPGQVLHLDFGLPATALSALPAGSTLDETGIWHWRVQPGYFGDFPLSVQRSDGRTVQVRLRIRN